MPDITIVQLREGVAYADQWLAHQLQVQRTPGVAVAIRHRDELLLSRAYGFANLEEQIPLTPQHIFRVASHSKTFTATAIMQLVEAGTLRLDDPIGQFIPWLQSKENLARLTIRQLLNHAGGVIRDGIEADYWELEEPFPDAGRLRYLVEEVVEVLPPSETFKYSNIGYSLLGLVIEAASGMPYNEYVRRHIVDRLGLTSTGPETDAAVRGRLATGYTKPHSGIPRRPLSDVETGAMSAATGFYSTAEDLTRYASAHFFGNEELLSDTSKREMQQPYYAIEHGDGERYGLGFESATVGERRLVGHSGGFPGHATRTWFDPRDSLAVVVLTNETGGPAATLAGTIVKIIDYALKQPPRDPGRSYERYAGRFVNLSGVSDVAHFGNTLVGLGPDSLDPTKYATLLTVEDDNTLRMTQTNGYGSQGETVRYTRNEQGDVVKIVSGGISSYPLELFRQRSSPM